MLVKVIGHSNGVHMEIEIPDDTPIAEAEEIVGLLQDIADMYGSVKELSKNLDEAARKLGLEIWRVH